MAFNDNVTIVGPGWTQLTANDATAVTYQNTSTATIVLLATFGITPPLANAEGIRVLPGEGQASMNLAATFPGIGTPNRLWGRIIYGNPKDAEVFVSHA